MALVLAGGAVPVVDLRAVLALFIAAILAAIWQCPADQLTRKSA